MPYPGELASRDLPLCSCFWRPILPETSLFLRQVFACQGRRMVGDERLELPTSSV